MARPKSFITRLLPEDTMDFIRRTTEMEVWTSEEPPPPQVLREKIANTDGVLTNVMDRIDETILRAAPNLKVISQLAAGLDNIDVSAATRRHIPIGYTPEVVSEVTADHTFALMLSAAHRVNESERWLRKGNWKIAFHPLFWLGSEVHHSTLGIVGMGKIGLEMAKRAKGFSMRLLYFSRSRNRKAEDDYKASFADLTTLLKSSDFVTLHVPLTPETHHMIGLEQLRSMKPTSILINAARGSVVDPKALHTALTEKWITGAALDVTDPEPIQADDPLLTLDNLVITPHLGSATIQSRRRMADLAAKNLIAGLTGVTLPMCANPTVNY